MKSHAIIFTTILSAAACFWLLPRAEAVNPVPDGCYPGFTTAEGCNALNSLTTGAGNTGVGWRSLFSNTTSNFNTGVGAGTLLLNTSGSNTGVGAAALLLNTGGFNNTAVGTAALVNNDSGNFNDAVGAFALNSNTAGFSNNALGESALLSNIHASGNTAIGDVALALNDSDGAGLGNNNTAVGAATLVNNVDGSENTAIGDHALRFNVDGSFNVAVGDEAGTGLGASVNNCIAIGAPGDGPFATFDNTCFIGSIFGEPVSDPGSQVPVYVDQFNNVGVFSTSSRRVKHDIQPMDKASETLYQFKPVTFKYNSDWKGTTQYGLIAEEVAEVDPQLVVRGRDGEIMAVHYEQISNMLLNEFLKEHKKVEELQATVAQQQKGMEVLTAQLKEQATQIQKVSAQLAISKPAAKVVSKKP